MIRNRYFYIISAAILLLLAPGSLSGASPRTDGRLIDAVSLFSSGKYKEALTLLDALAADEPDNDAAYYYMGLSCCYDGQMEKAEEYLREAVRLDPGNYWYKDFLARVYGAEGKTPETTAIYEQLIHDYPRKTGIYYALVDLYFRSGEFDKTLSALSEIEKVQGPGEQTILYRTEIFRMRRSWPDFFASLNDFLELEDVPSAQKAQYLGDAASRTDASVINNYRPQLDYAVDLCLEKDPLDSNALRLAGTYYFSTGRTDKGMEHLRTARQTYPESFSLRGLYVQALANTEQWDEMICECEECAELFRHDPAFLRMKAGAYLQQSDYDSFVATNLDLVRQFPDDTAYVVEALTSVGDVYYAHGVGKEAYRYYDKALRIKPDYVPALNNYAYYLSMEGRRLRKAYAMSKVTVEAEPDNPTYLDTFGWILHLQGKSLEAKPFFKHAMLYGGKESAVMLDHYAEVLFALGEYDLARMYWEMALKKDDAGEIPDLEERMRRHLDSVR